MTKRVAKESGGNQAEVIARRRPDNLHMSDLPLHSISSSSSVILHSRSKLDVVERKKEGVPLSSSSRLTTKTTEKERRGGY